MHEPESTFPTLTESEAIASGLLVWAAAVMTTAWLVDWVSLPIAPLPVLAASMAVTASLAAGAWRLGLRLEPVSPGRLSAVLLVVIGCAAYLARLSWPSLLPVSEGPDLVHHLQLIHFIQQRHLLAHDHTFGAYLGEMDGYTPGSHLLAAVLADAAGVDGLRLLYPLTVLFVALKTGLVFNILLRILPGVPTRVASAVAGTLLLLVPHAYFLRSFTHYYFYAQVVSETYAIAILWAVVAWHQRPERVWPAAIAIFAIAVVLCWPVWLPVPALTAAVVMLRCRGLSLRDRAVDVVLATLPAVVVMVIYSLTHTASTGILSSGGETVEPSARAFGWPFLALAGAGILLGLRRHRSMLAVLVFGGACLAQIAGLTVVQRSLGASNPYLAYKTVHLLIYPLVLCGAIALDAGWESVIGRLRGRWLRPAAWAPPIAIVILLLETDLPRRPLRSPITEPVHQAGLWAKAHLPSPCVDYMVQHWLTAYWLDVDILGNPREAARMSRVGYPEAVGRWILPGGPPFAIAERVDDLPSEVRQTMQVRARFGPAAVVECTGGRSACTDTTPPIDAIKYSR
jgi:hypothetical protein